MTTSNISPKLPLPTVVAFLMWLAISMLFYASPGHAAQFDVRNRTPHDVKQICVSMAGVGRYCWNPLFWLTWARIYQWGNEEFQPDQVYGLNFPDCEVDLRVDFVKDGDYETVLAPYYGETISCEILPSGTCERRLDIVDYVPVKRPVRTITEYYHGVNICRTRVFDLD